MKSRVVSLALIGAGRVGEVHAANIAAGIPGARLAAIADVNLDAAGRLARRFGVERIVPDYRELLGDPAIDGIVVCSGTNTHLPIIEDGARARKQIFCEKPIGLDVAGIRHALETVARNAVKLQIGFNRRFDPDFAGMREHVASGRIGEPHIVRITSRDPAPPPLEYIRASGGLPVDMSIHDYDMVRFMTGQEVTEVFAQGGVLVDAAIGQCSDIDTCVTMLRLSGGAFAMIDNSRKAVYGYDQRVEVFGSAGMTAAGSPALERHCQLLAREMNPTEGKLFFLERYREAFLIEMREFVDCIADDRTPSVNGLDGLKAVLIAFAVSKSLREHRPVALSEMFPD